MSRGWKITVAQRESVSLQSDLSTLKDSPNQIVIQQSLCTPKSMFDHRDIPADIWTIIFKACLSPARYFSEHHFVNPSADNAPLVFTHVCKRWREMAVGDPQLWTSFIMRGCATEEHDRVGHLELAKLWLGRSGTLPLSICLDSVASVEKELQETQETQELLSLFISLIPRWEHITIYLPLLHGFDLELIPMGGAPLLRSIEIIATPRVPRTGISLLLDPRFARCLGNLRRLTFHCGCMTGKFFMTFPLPFKQMTHLNIENQLTADYAFLILETTAENLICGKFEVLFEARPTQGKWPVMMPRLLDLCIFFRWKDIGSMEDEAHLLNFITAPLLRDLTISQTEYWSQRPFEEFINRSGCRLRQLVFLRASMDVKDVFDCLVLNPGLECFHGGRVRDKNEAQTANRKLIKALERFDEEKGEFVLCPKLRELGCDLGHVKVDRCRPFSGMVKRRMSPLAGRGYFKKVSIVNHCVGGPDQSGYVQPLRELEGMGLVVNYMVKPTVHWSFKY